MSIVYSNDNCYLNNMFIVYSNKYASNSTFVFGTNTNEYKARRVLVYLKESWKAASPRCS